jgi:hypothetical protein
VGLTGDVFFISWIPPTTFRAGLGAALPAGHRPLHAARRWATGGREWRGLERFAEMCQGLTLRERSHPGLRPLCEPPVRGEPAPAGRLLKAGCRRRSSGTQTETSPRPGPSAWPTRSARCRVSGAFHEVRNSLRWRARRPHAHRSRIAESRSSAKGGRAQCRSRCSKGGWFGRIEDRRGGQDQEDEQGGKLHANADQMTCAMCVG